MRVIERRLPLGEVSYPVGLSFLLHGLLALAVVYAPPWFRGKPFRVPVSYEVTLVAPLGGGGQPKASLALPPRSRVATALAKTAAPLPAAAQPRELLTLPSVPRPVVPQAVVRPLPPPTRTEEMALPAKRSVPDRRSIEDAVPPRPAADNPTPGRAPPALGPARGRPPSPVSRVPPAGEGPGALSRRRGAALGPGDGADPGG